jgi:ribosomal protein S27AE
MEIHMAVHKMKCPRCGAEMNLHAEKIVYGVSTASAVEEPSGTDEVLQEFHACPRCGATEARNASDGLGTETTLS